jgi:hypothetical protein
MYCSTCGARVPDGRANCQTCGAAMPRLPQHPAAIPAMATQPGGFAEPIGMCPRCGFRGQSVGYFTRGGHVAALVILGVVTFPWLMGAGGIIYYLLRRDHRVCPRCGDSWGKHAAFALAPGAPGAPALPAGARMPEPDLVGSGGGVRRFLAYSLFAFAAFLMMVGFGEAELAPILFGLFAGGGGWLLQRSAREARERRREALVQSLQLPVLQLAGRKGGRLTVTDVATGLGWPMTRAEKVLNSLEDGMRVMSDITDDGVIVYDFLEIRAAQLAAAAPAPAALPHGAASAGAAQAAPPPPAAFPESAGPTHSAVA